MRSGFIKLVLAITVSAMVALAVMGIFIIASESRESSIVVPPQRSIKKLPNQAPKQSPGKRYIRPGDINPDMPGPR